MKDCERFFKIKAHPSLKPISEFKPSQKLRFEIEARGSIRDLRYKYHNNQNNI